MSEQQLLHLLEQCRPDALSDHVFARMAQLVVSPVVELVCLREHEQQLQVLALLRPEDDPVWPGAWHTPGTVLRPSDASLDEALQRLCKHELGAQPARIRRAGELLHRSERGSEWAQIYWADRLPAEAAGSWMEVNQFRQQMIDSQRAVLDLALRSYHAA